MREHIDTSVIHDVTDVERFIRRAGGWSALTTDHVDALTECQARLTLVATELRRAGRVVPAREREEARQLIADGLRDPEGHDEKIKAELAADAVLCGKGYARG